MNATQPTSSTPTISSVVATGRRINMREGFITFSRLVLECHLLHVGMNAASHFVVSIPRCWKVFLASAVFAPLQSPEHSYSGWVVRLVARCAILAAACPDHR